jgi:hypothetical protein
MNAPNPALNLTDLLEKIPHLAAAGMYLSGSVVPLVHHAEVLPKWPADVFTDLWKTFQVAQQHEINCSHQRWVLRDGFIWAFYNPPLSCLGLLLKNHDLTAEDAALIKTTFCRNT